MKSSPIAIPQSNLPFSVERVNLIGELLQGTDSHALTEIFDADCGDVYKICLLIQQEYKSGDKSQTL